MKTGVGVGVGEEYANKSQGLYGIDSQITDPAQESLGVRIGELLSGTQLNTPIHFFGSSFKMEESRFDILVRFLWFCQAEWLWLFRWVVG